jgi:hypothetical protein
MPEIESDATLDALRQSMASEPTLKKSMVVARPIGYFENGDQEGDLDPEDIVAIVKNFGFRKHVPIFLWYHPMDLDEAPPHGWVEGVHVAAKGEVVSGKRLKGGELVADVKLFEEASRLVLGDRVRGSSIAWNPAATDYAGKPIGCTLIHLTLTNKPFIKDLPSIAAARDKGGAPLSYCFTALEGRSMPEDRKSKESEAEQMLTDSGADPVKRAEALEILLEQSREKTRELTAVNDNLLQENKDLRRASENNPSDRENRAMKRQVLAMRVRELVKRGLDNGQFLHEDVTGFDSLEDEVTLAWFSKSIFEGDLKILQQNLRTRPKRKLNREFSHGAPVDNDTAEFAADEREQVTAMGRDPEKLVRAGKGALSFSEFKRRKAAQKVG